MNISEREEQAKLYLTCKCGSYDINEDPKKRTCDVCYWKNKYFKFKVRLKNKGKLPAPILLSPSEQKQEWSNKWK
jgi:hypothetical protein